MGNYMSARNTRKRTSSDASLDTEDDENIRSKKYVLRLKFLSYVTRQMYYYTNHGILLNRRARSTHSVHRYVHTACTLKFTPHYATQSAV